MVRARESQIMTPAMKRIKKIQKKEIATPEERSQLRKGWEDILLIPTPARSIHRAFTRSAKIFSASCCRFRRSTIDLIESRTSPTSTISPSPCLMSLLLSSCIDVELSVWSWMSPKSGTHRPAIPMLLMVYAGHFLSLIRLISGSPLSAATALFHSSFVIDGMHRFRWNSRSKSGNPGIWSIGKPPVFAMAYAYRDVVCIGHSFTHTWLILDVEFEKVF